MLNLLSSFAGWLDTTFYTFDNTLLTAFRELHLSAGGFFDSFFRAISFLGNSGWAMIVVAVILLLFCRTRKAGLTAGVALIIGMIITNLLLKNLVMRTRPYDADPTYFIWFSEVFGERLSDNSFPSGHTTATFALVTALFLSFDKRYSWTGYLFGILMGISRIYLCVHYPTDVIVGAVVGITAGIISYYIVKWLYNVICSYNNAFTRFWRNEDLLTLWKRVNK